MGELSLRRGDARQGLDRAARCVELAEATGMAENLVKGLRLRGEALLALGELEGAADALGHTGKSPDAG